MNDLIEGFEYEFSAVDPVAGAHIDPVSHAVYESVIAKGENGEAVPWIASDFSVSQHQTVWTFRIRDDVYFHSGEKCDARMIVAALERCRWGDNRTRQLHYFDPIASIAATDEFTLEIRSHYPTTRVFPALWGTHSTIFNPKVRERTPGRLYGREVVDGTGPYRVSGWSPEKVVAERAASYQRTGPAFAKSRGTPSIDTITWHSIRGISHRAERILSGELDCLHSPGASSIETLRQDHRLLVSSEPESSNVYLALNWKRRDLDFNITEMRRAFSLAFDRQAIVDVAVKGFGVPTYGPVPPDAEFYSSKPDATGQCSRETANQLLTQMGWLLEEDGIRYRSGEPLEFGCVVQDDEVLLAAALEIRKQLAMVGIRARVETARPFESFYTQLGNRPDAFISKWLWPDPIDALAGFTSTPCQPRANWQFASVPELDRAFDMFRQATDHNGLVRSADRIQTLISEHLPLIPLFTPAKFWAWNRRLSGWDSIRNNLYPYYFSANKNK